jgi:hypothetical protein
MFFKVLKTFWLIQLWPNQRILIIELLLELISDMELIENPPRCSEEKFLIPRYPGVKLLNIL